MLCCEAAVDGDSFTVIVGGIWKLVPLLFGIFADQPTAVGESVTRLIIQDEVILRVPVQPHRLVPDVDWIERKGPRCIPAAAIQRALLSTPEQVDFVLANRSRVRARLDENCPALDFYAGFYLQPHGDMLCAGRDAIYSRIGGNCKIESFSQLVPKPRR
jgi:hypothetical protein